MNPEDVSLSSVNWEHGMLLTPTHFLRQEKYFEAGLLWVLRYATNAFGLVGGGPRLPDAERGAVRNDPVVVMDEDEQSVGIAVTQCRALTPAGCIVEIEPVHAVQRRFAKTELENVAESLIYLVADPGEKQVDDGPVDEFNPQMKTERRPLYVLSLQVHADSAPYAVAVGKLRRQRYGAGYEKDTSFIPACTSMASYSELAAAWRSIVDTVTLLTERYTELNRAMREFLVLFTERGIDTQTDVDTASFVEHMTVALHNCIYDLIDPLQPPQQFFGKLRRLFHSAASYFELTPAVQQYYETLKQTGESEFITLVEQQKRILQSTRSWTVQEDLGIEVRSVTALLDGLQRLERALEGKYIDFHLSPSLEAMNFVFDRGGKALYKLAAKPSRAQGVGDDLTMYFSQLRLEGRDKYRLILVGEREAVFEKGAKITVEIRINETSGFRRQPAIVSCESRLAEQCNFEFDFDAPDVPTITDLQVTLPAHLPIRTALLFTRHRFWAQRAEEPVRSVEPLAAPPRIAPVPEAVRPPAVQPPPPRLEPRPPAAAEPEPPAGDKAAPWETPRRYDRPRPPDQQPPQPPPVRRRRLE
jgi:hypothetical protein